MNGDGESQRMSAAEIARLSSTAALQLGSGRFPEAIATYQELLAQWPDRPDDWFNLGYAQRAMRRFDDALSSYAEAIARGVRQPEEARVNRAAILSEHLFRPDEAERELLAALAAAPAFLIAWYNLGQLREDRNDRKGAREAYRSVLALAPHDGRANARLAALDVFEGEAAGAVARLRNLLAAASDREGTAELSFAMANALDAAGDYDAAFSMFQRANALAAQVAARGYDAAAQDSLVEDIIAAFPAAKRGSIVAPAVPEPLFVCGMFRSGSTLCEQLLARHSTITSGGELEIVPAIAAGGISPYPAAITTMSDMQIEGFRDGYLADLRALFPGARIVTDKRPDNFLHIGLIKAMFPSSRIVHTVRNAIDNILSVFFLYFADGVTYGSRLDDILHYYRSYQRLMAHWQRLYPDIVDVDYDRLVSEPQAEAKSLFARLGLEWEDGCDPARAVVSNIRTASAWQVRQPIHKRSTGRWRNYARHVSQLREALEGN